jgi:glutathione S-transferase
MVSVVKKHSISSELPQKMVNEAVAKARELGVTENVAILDDGGNLKAFGRMDGAPILCIEIAQIAGPHDYEQIPELAERGKLRVKSFFADFDARLDEAPFVAGQRFSAADITALVTVDFAAKAINFSVPNEHRSLKRWYDAISSGSSMAA